jgi:hypothetical protein
MPPKDVNPDFQMRALHFAIDRFTDVVQKCGAHRDLSVQPDLARHDAREV